MFSQQTITKPRQIKLNVNLSRSKSSKIFIHDVVCRIAIKIELKHRNLLIQMYRLYLNNYIKYIYNLYIIHHSVSCTLNVFDDCAIETFTCFQANINKKKRKIST